MRNRPLRYFLAALIVGAPLLVYVVLLSRHWSGSTPTDAEIALARKRAEQWILDHRTNLLYGPDNPILWWMLSRSAKLTGNGDIDALVADYREIRMNSVYANPWRMLLEPDYRMEFVTQAVEDLPDYQQMFLFGLSCSPALGQRPTIQAQFEESFCWAQHPLALACSTHQLMGLRFARESGCAIKDLPQLIETVTGRVETALHWDPRHIDVFLQRALMVAEERGAQAVPGPILRSVLDSQLPDGGWGNFHALVPLGQKYYLGLDHRSLRRYAPRSNFHATAQALLLLSLLERDADDRPALLNE